MSKPSFFLYSEEGALLSLAILLERHGYKQTLYIKDDHGQEIGRGLVSKTDNPNPPAGSTVIFDMGGFSRIGAALRERGYAVIGGNPAELELEKDRAAARKIMQKAGIEVPTTHDFDSFEKAKAWLKQNEGAWFIKISGSAGDGSTTNTDSSEEMLRYLTWLEDSGFKADSFELQEPVIGSEIDIEGWFDGTKWVAEMMPATIEEKRLMAGGLGPQTGSESSLLWLKSTDKLFSVLEPMKEYLRENKYVGPLACNLVVDESNVPRALEFTARLGWHESHANFLWLGKTLGDQLDAFARGELKAFEIESPGPIMLMNIAVPPYPHFWYAEAAKMQGFPLDPKILTDERITPEDVLRNNDGFPGMGGRNGNLGTIASCAESLGDQRKETLEVAEHLHIPKLQYRNDPVARAEETIEDLTRQGWLPETSKPVAPVPETKYKRSIL